MHPSFPCFHYISQYLLIDFRQTFVTGASWDTDDLITFLGQKVKVQGHTIAAEAHSTRRYRRALLPVLEKPLKAAAVKMKSNAWLFGMSVLEGNFLINFPKISGKIRLE